jgi:hypothetical protein
MKGFRKDIRLSTVSERSVDGPNVLCVYGKEGQASQGYVVSLEL